MSQNCSQGTQHPPPPLLLGRLDGAILVPLEGVQTTNRPRYPKDIIAKGQSTVSRIHMRLAKITASQQNR
jgi:hypothetical protein